jgi:serine/threonine protein kinase
VGWEVYRATDTNLKRQVAIKVLPASVAGDAERLARFQREAEVLAALNHPNIAQIHGVEKSDGTIALVMELVEGDDLSQLIARGALPFDEALPIAKQIAEALEAAHEQGIVHRDLKPANVMLDKAGRVRILDVGLARALGEAGGSLTRPGWILGTADYMAPEQAEGPQNADARSDLYSLGCTFHFLLRGQPPYPAQTLVEAIVAHREQPLPNLGPEMAPEIQSVLDKLLAKKPRDRFASAAEVLVRVRAIRKARGGDDRTVISETPATDLRRFLTKSVESAEAIAKPARASLQFNATFGKTGCSIVIALCLMVMAAGVSVMMNLTSPSPFGFDPDNRDGLRSKSSGRLTSHDVIEMITCLVGESGTCTGFAPLTAATTIEREWADWSTIMKSERHDKAPEK